MRNTSETLFLATEGKSRLRLRTGARGTTADTIGARSRVSLWRALFVGLLASGLSLSATADSPSFQPVNPAPHGPATVEESAETSLYLESVGCKSCFARLAQAALHSLAQNSTHAACATGGSLHAHCRSAGNRTFVAAELRTCGLPVDAHRTLYAAGELMLTLPQAEACRKLMESPCGVVMVEKTRLVATLTDARGKVLATLNLENTRVPKTVVVPCSVPPRNTASL